MLSSHVPSSTAVFLTFLVPVCLFAGIQSQISVTPAVKCVLPEESIVTVTCKTTTKALLWIYNRTDQKFYNKDSMPNEQADLGIFTVRLTMIDVVGDNVNLTSLATVSVSSLVDRVTVITCDGDGDGLNGRDALLINGPPSPSSVTSIVTTQSSTNSSSLLISWSMSDCAVQYVVTIINSSDGSVYLNITTSDTNTTVTLPTGVEYCVTVLGVDSINRTGPPSQQQCYMHSGLQTSVSTTLIMSTSAISSNDAATSTVTPTGPTNQISGEGIAAIILAICLIFSLAFTLCLLIFLLLRRRGTASAHFSADNSELVNFTKQADKEYHCYCQVYNQEIALNSWKIIFAFVSSKDHLEAVKNFVKFDEYNSPMDCHLKSSGKIRVVVPGKIANEWTVEFGKKVNITDIENYSGSGSPPHIEMIITADSEKTTPPDLTVQAKLTGVRKPNNIIKFEKEAQNVVECLCKVSYYKEGLNHWKAKFAFFPREQLERVDKFYQDANNCELPFAVKFGGGEIKISNDMTELEATIDSRHQQVSTAEVEQYTGEGEPPYCEMTLRATDNYTQHNMIQPVTLNGTRGSKFTVKRALEDSVGIPLFVPLAECREKGFTCICQVFYHKLGVNRWNATLAFFPERRMDRVQQFYQDANIGEVTSVVFPKRKIIQLNFTKKIYRWNVFLIGEIKRSELAQYTGESKPPCCEMELVAAYDDVTPLDLDFSIPLTETSEIMIRRTAEAFQSKEYVCEVYCLEEGLNKWRFVFAFIESKYVNTVRKFFENVKFTKYGTTLKCKLRSDVITIFTQPLQEWNVHFEASVKEIGQADIKKYTGEGEPPHCEMTISNANTEITPPDLNIVATIRDTRGPIDRIELRKEAQTVTECVCKLFYHRKGFNSWNATLAFFPKSQLLMMNSLYQDSNNRSPAEDLKFSGGKIEVYTKKLMTEWKFTAKHQVSTAEVEQYTGDGDPPHCEMTIRAVDSGTPPDLTLPVIITGVKQPTTITLERVAETSDGVVRPLPTAQISKSHDSTMLVCQVFYRKNGLNSWNVILAIFPKDKTERVHEIYQDANIGPTIDLQFKTLVGRSISVIVEKSIEERDDPWSCERSDANVTKQDILSYTGEGEPKALVVVFNKTGHGQEQCHLDKTLSLSSIKLPNRLLVQRKAESDDVSQEQDGFVVIPDTVDDENHSPETRFRSLTEIKKKDEKDASFTFTSLPV